MKIQANLTPTGYVIEKNSLVKLQLDNIKNDLTVQPNVSMDYGIAPEKFSLFNETDSQIIIPRYYGEKKFGIAPQNTEFKNRNSKVDFDFNGSLRGSQPEIASYVLKKLETKGGGLLQLHTGYGKTTMSIYLASVLKLKTLVIVHKSFLQDQWYDRIKQFTNASIGFIRQKKVDVEGKDIVIGMLQSISMIDYNMSIFKDFDLVIVDECHHIGSKVFSKALAKICPKYTIGLSATPKRQDGLMKVVNWFLGDILVKVEREGDNAVYVKNFQYTSTNPLFAEKLRYINRKNRPDTVKMITNMYKIGERNNFIVKIINSIRENENRKTIVLSGRKDHLKELKKLVDECINKDVKDGKLLQDEYKTSFYIGGMKEYELRDATEADIIFATFAMAEEGLDIDGLNTLILATPKKDIVQSIGRIMRKPLEEGDINPLVIDITDELSCFSKWGILRSSYYEDNKYSINNYRVLNTDIIEFKKFMLNKNIITIQQYNSNDCDLRKEYITNMYGIESYESQLECDFVDYPISMFEYDCNLNTTFDIDHDYGSNTEKKGSVITYIE